MEMTAPLPDPVDSTELESGPIDEYEMDITRWEGHHSVCQTIRDIYHMIDNPQAKLKCRLAMNMTKKMHQRLKWYKQQEEERANERR